MQPLAIPPTASPLTGLRRAVDDFHRQFRSSPDDPALSYLAGSAAMSQLLAQLRAAELDGVAPEQIREAVAPARAIHGATPLLGRTHTWPRGYPGDFETIEYLCLGVPMAEEAPLRTLESLWLDSGPAQQHRNKLTWQGEQFLQAVAGAPPARLLSVACGGSRELAAILPSLRGRDFELYLNDADREALAMSQRRLEAVAGQVTLVPGDVFRAVRRLRRLPPLDLVVAGGLFDYLDDRHLAWLLPRLRDLLAPGGALCFTNIAAGCPFAGWMEYLADWRLIYRSEEQVERLVRAAGLASDDRLEIVRDGTRLALLVRWTRGGARQRRPAESAAPRVVTGAEAQGFGGAEKWRLLSPSLRRFGGEAISYATLQDGLEYYLDRRGYIAFVTVQHPLLSPRPRRIVLGDPLCDRSDMAGLVRSFLEDGPQAAFGVISEGCAEVLRELGFRATCIGYEPELPIQTYDTAGNWKELDLVKRARNEVRREGITIREVDVATLDRAELDAVSRRWLAGKPVHDREIWIYARRPVFGPEPDVRKFVAFDRDGRVAGFVFYDPMYRDGQVVGYSANTPRTDEQRFGRLTTAIHMVAMDAFRAEGKETLNLCLAPFVKLDLGRFNDDGGLRSFFELTARFGGAIYNFDGLSFHKSKYRGREKPVYFASRSRLASNEVYLAFRAAGISQSYLATIGQLLQGMARAGLRRTRGRGPVAPL